MIRNDDVFKIGKIRGLHGIGGEVEMTFTDDVFDRVDAEYVFLKMDGLQVPFFIKEYRFKNDECVYMRFEDVDSEARARSICGAEVFFPLSLVPEKRKEESLSWKYLTGFKIIDEKEENIVVVECVDDSSANIVLTVTREDGREVLIPIHPDLVMDCDEKQRVLKLHLPEGLLDLNNEAK